MSAIRLLKGHGTGNDFVILPDHDGALGLTADQARRLADRHRGIGGDGVLRVVRVAADAEASALADDLAAADPTGDPAADAPEWFMDYRNADGSAAEMCGNGVRVFAQYLAESGLAGDRFDLLTRGGARTLSAAGPGRWIAAMGRAHRLAERPRVTPRDGEPTIALAALEIPNPHVVVPVADETALAGLDLSRPPAVEPALPQGQNVEFVAITGPRSIAMRVHERGVGETQSCGTGICAAAVAVAATAANASAGSAADAADQQWTVAVPGGECLVRIRPDGEVLLDGPAEIVAALEVDAAWLRGG